MNLPPVGTGWIEVICGSMFSGKTVELLRRLRAVLHAKQTVRLFRPAVDRPHPPQEDPHVLGERLPSRAVARAEEILELCHGGVQVVGVDDAQFFEEALVEVCRELARSGTRIVVAGLEQDHRCRPFPTVAALLVEAELITKNLAICVICGNPALRTQRTATREGRIVVGGSGIYEARCRHCHEAGAGAPDAGLFEEARGQS